MWNLSDDNIVFQQSINASRDFGVRERALTRKMFFEQKRKRLQMQKLKIRELVCYRLTSQETY
jgi:hypothetical protein